MNCPKCYEPLRIAERQGVEIDYCPECRGVWLDRGELDKIVERTLRTEAPAPPRHDPYPSSSDRRDAYHREKPHYDKHYHKKKYKKKHILKEILDILD